jgi:hypothetical protein
MAGMTKTKAIAAGLAAMLLMMFVVSVMHMRNDDFRQFYRAASLAREHRDVYANPWYPPANGEPAVYLPFNRLPSYAWALQPLAALPYRQARIVWYALAGLAFCGCIWLFPAARYRLGAALALSLPVAVAISIGQDIGFVLLIALAAARLADNGRDFSSGLAASLMAIKASFLPAVAIVYLVRSRKGVSGFALGVLVQLAISFAFQGVSWVSEYRAQLQYSLAAFIPRWMPNLRSMTTSLSLPTPIYVAAVIAVYVWLWRICQTTTPAKAMLVALPVGMIASPQCFVYDAAACIPLLVLVSSTERFDGLLAAAALTPIPALLMMSDRGAPQIAGALFVASTIAGVARFARLEARENRFAPVLAVAASPSLG